MSNLLSREDYEQIFHEQIIELEPHFNGVECFDFREGLMLDFVGEVDEYDSGSSGRPDAHFREVIPPVQYEGKHSASKLRISRTSIQDFSERLKIDSENIIAPRTLVRSGVARFLLARSVHDAVLRGEDSKMLEIYDLFVQSDPVLSALNQLGTEVAGVSINSVSKLEDSEIKKINTLRFAVAIGLSGLREDERGLWAAGTLDIFEEQEKTRLLCYAQNTSIIGERSASALFDDMLSYEALACAIPIERHDSIGLEIVARGDLI